ncbi:hypothetical protein EV651_110140 [Kribbella sp. VKM Ac-2571]|uniref:hypothetical protein n=1 Tax=Kribbella sp. VKM Ac-2571 TaxID=2512222 RepID=UPI001060275B|nr:hypothetical protein [Kribbella sp. VKM Ac-2571]TDO58106.1 hypothetical protein EV651_110140 [Kribbella sp. VKM Ac-2571]
MTDDSETSRLVNTDVSTLTPAEMRAHLNAVERRMKHLLRTERDLLETSAQVLIDHPELQSRLEYLRTVDLDDPADPDS